MTSPTPPNPSHIGRWSPRAAQTAALFGLTLAAHTSAPTPRPADIRRIIRAAQPATITLITGSSGSGKSTLLRHLSHSLPRTPHPPILADLLNLPLPDSPLIDLFPDLPIEQAIHYLSRAGLGEARCLTQKPSELSGGQLLRARLAFLLARTRAEAQPLLLDEFASNLDPITTRALCTLLARHARAAQLRLIIAAAREDLAPYLSPDHHEHLSHTGHAEPQPLNHAPPPDSITITKATIHHYRALAPFHYRAARPAPIIHALAAFDAPSTQPIGILTISMPILNAPWRSLAWPHLFNHTTTPSEAARIINHPHRGIRCISRIIIDPRYRASGLATRLVRHYLNNPLTDHTESLAVMARFSGFLTRAGMTAHTIPLAERHTRLLTLLARHNIEPWMLAIPDFTYNRLTRQLPVPRLRRELIAWARASKSDRRHAARHTTTRTLFTLAAARLASRPTAYTCTREASGATHHEHGQSLL